MSELDEVAQTIYTKYYFFWPITAVQAARIVDYNMQGETNTVKQGVVNGLLKFNRAAKRVNYLSPVNKDHKGVLFFINRVSRMTRVWDVGRMPIPAKGWIKVSEEDYNAFRKETAALSPAKRKSALGKKA